MGIYEFTLNIHQSYVDAVLGYAEESKKETPYIMDFFTGEDIFEFLRELLLDIQNLSDADIISVLFRITLVVIGLAVLTAFTKFLYRILQDIFKKPVKLILRFVTAPYRVPTSAFRSWRRNKRFNQEKKLREAQEMASQIQRAQEKQIQEQRESKRNLITS